MTEKYKIYFMGSAGTLFSAYGCDMIEDDLFYSFSSAKREIFELTEKHPNLTFTILTVYVKEEGMR